MSDKVDVFMPLYVADYLRDTAELSLEEHGAYSRLLLHMWGRKGRLVYDHDRLARLVGCDREQWSRIWPVIEGLFELDHAGGFISQKRLVREIELAQDRKAAAAESGRRGAEARWQRPTPPIGLRAVTDSGSIGTPLPTPLGTPLPVPLATPMPNGWRIDGSSPSPSKEEEESAAPPARDPSAAGGATAQPWRSAYEWGESFKLPWAVKYSGRFYGNAGDGKAQRDLEDQVLSKMPEGELKALWDRRGEHFAMYLASDDPFLVKSRHPFAMFVVRFCDFRPDIAAPLDARAPPRRARAADITRGHAAPSTNYGPPGEQKL